jgi:hypothetical protein
MKKVKPLQVLLCLSKDDFRTLIRELLQEIKKERPESFREKIKQKGVRKNG